MKAIEEMSIIKCVFFIARLGAAGIMPFFSSLCLYVINTRFYREMDYVANMHFLVLFGPRFYSDNWTQKLRVKRLIITMHCYKIKCKMEG